MNIFHCLFWIKDDRITLLSYQEGKLIMIKIRGMNAVPLTDEYWTEWREYAGMCSEDKTDICLISDSKTIPEALLLSAQCDGKDCIWSRSKIEEAVKLLEITKPTEITDEEGKLLAKAGSFINITEDNVVRMTAWYRKHDNNAQESKLPPEETTALIQYYKAELRKYKEGYET